MNDITRFIPCYLSMMKYYVLPPEINRLSNCPGSARSLVAFSMMDRPRSKDIIRYPGIVQNICQGWQEPVTRSTQHPEGNESSAEAGAGGIYFRSGDMITVNRSTPGDHSTEPISCSYLNITSWNSLMSCLKYENRRNIK